MIFAHHGMALKEMWIITFIDLNIYSLVYYFISTIIYIYQLGYLLSIDLFKIKPVYILDHNN